MKTKASTYKKDPYYGKVVAAVTQLFKTQTVITPVEVFMQMGHLSKADYEHWRFGRVAYLERVITCNLSKAGRILHILRLHAQACGFRPSHTAYVRWGKGPKRPLRFSKAGTLPLRRFLLIMLSNQRVSPKAKRTLKNKSVAQWRVLRRAVQGAGGWAPVNMLAWGAGMPLIFWGIEAAQQRQTLLEALLLLAGILFLTGAVVGAIQGAFLVWLVGRKAVPGAKSDAR